MDNLSIDEMQKLIDRFAKCCGSSSSAAKIVQNCGHNEFIMTTEERFCRSPDEPLTFKCTCNKCGRTFIR